MFFLVMARVRVLAYARFWTAIALVVFATVGIRIITGAVWNATVLPVVIEIIIFVCATSRVFFICGTVQITASLLGVCPIFAVASCSTVPPLAFESIVIATYICTRVWIVTVTIRIVTHLAVFLRCIIVFSLRFELLEIVLEVIALV